VSGCQSTSCHAWDRLTDHYNHPSDASLTLWIIGPIVLIVGLALLVLKLK
jgi:hypothetical protein